MSELFPLIVWIVVIIAIVNSNKKKKAEAAKKQHAAAGMKGPAAASGGRIELAEGVSTEGSIRMPKPEPHVHEGKPMPCPAEEREQKAAKRQQAAAKSEPVRSAYQPVRSRMKTGSITMPKPEPHVHEGKPMPCPAEEREFVRPETIAPRRVAAAKTTAKSESGLDSLFTQQGVVNGVIMSEILNRPKFENGRRVIR